MISKHVQHPPSTRLMIGPWNHLTRTSAVFPKEMSSGNISEPKIYSVCLSKIMSQTTSEMNKIFWIQYNLQNWTRFWPYYSIWPYLGKWYISFSVEFCKFSTLPFSITFLSIVTRSKRRFSGKYEGLHFVLCRLSRHATCSWKMDNETLQRCAFDTFVFIPLTTFFLVS